MPAISGHEAGLRRVSPDNTPALEASFNDDERAQAAGEPPRTVAIVSADFSEPAAYRSPKAIEFYLQPGPEEFGWQNTVTVRSNRAARLYEPGVWVSRVSPTPLLIIVATEDELTGTDLALDAYERARQPKSVLLIEGGHFDPYLARFDEASSAALAWFNSHLN